ncbi:platelet glycoprotein Ib alpha chain-like [Lethenteron reissneri]|uniref:platelet glycoprotein Ib alpha chain-like n=1 Tax=Lethenteron reissneri TaxID=7753 RepID=UPI002AB69CA9|nr:platelet glycoprotein Ib alpha chain-like [Lethenteron reissneri]
MPLHELQFASLVLICLLVPSCSSDGRDESCDIGPDNAGRLRANCSSRGLRDFPTNLRTDIKVLWVTSNHLVAPTWAVLEGLPLLEELDLAHNRIVRLTPRAAMPILHIDASHNALTELPPLGYLLRLTRLKINDNQIAHLPADAFAALVDLQELFLGNNRLGTLDQSSFTNMDSLRMLSLHGNDLASVSANLMSSMSNLDVLDISNNSLKSLPRGFFEPVFLSYFYGYQNQWICDCSVAYLWEWMHDMNDDKVYNSLLQKDIESIVCSDHGPHSARPLYNLDKDSFCPATLDPSTNVAIPTFPIPVVKTTPRPATTASPSAPTTVQGKPTTAFQKMTTVSSTTAEMTTAQVTNVPSTVKATLSTTDRSQHRCYDHCPSHKRSLHCQGDSSYDGRSQHRCSQRRGDSREDHPIGGEHGGSNDEPSRHRTSANNHAVLRRLHQCHPAFKLHSQLQRRRRRRQRAWSQQPKRTRRAAPLHPQLCVIRPRVHVKRP